MMVVKMVGVAVGIHVEGMLYLVLAGSGGAESV